MTWDFLPTSTLIALIGSFAAGLAGTSITAWTTRKTHRERLAADEELAERRFKFDKELSQRKSDADIALEEKKFQLDARLADRKRRQDLAEEVLESFYKIRDVVRDVRMPLIHSDEFDLRKPPESESEDVTNQKNIFYVPLARLEKHRSDTAALLAKRYRSTAWFGPAADAPFQDVHQTLTDIASASKWLIREVDVQLKAPPHLHRQFTQVIWAEAADDSVAAKIDKAVTDIERILRPALEGQSA